VSEGFHRINRPTVVGAIITHYIDREFVTSAKEIANFNEFFEIKKIRKIRTKIR